MRLHRLQTAAELSTYQSIERPIASTYLSTDFAVYTSNRRLGEGG